MMNVEGGLIKSQSSKEQFHYLVSRAQFSIGRAKKIPTN
jgi:hypothetical protein